ncbi:MAG: hypothetical protein ABI824_08790 [Acidobacteriota bacterium]
MKLASLRSAQVVLLIAALAMPLVAQWKNLPMNGPKKADGSLDLAGPAPKTADGKPDFSGIWEQADLKYFRNLAVDMKPEEVPMRPEAKSILQARTNGALGNQEPDANCLPQGVPKINGAPVPFKIVQTPNLVMFVYEAFNLWRQVHMDSRELVDDPNPTWLGWSKGHWDGEALVIETRGFNGKAWLDTAGHPASDALHVTERLRRPSFGRIEMQITIDDPKMYTRSWTANEVLKLVTDTDLYEFVCLENERDLKHMNK